MISFLPAIHLARRAAGLPRREVVACAKKKWTIAPAEKFLAPAAYFLPGQLDRVTGIKFATEDYRREVIGGHEVEHAATIGYLVEGAIISKGVIYKADAATFLASRRSRIPSFEIEDEIDRGALYGTPGGIRYFGQWLIDDCITYPMAGAEGTPITIMHHESQHVSDYEKLLGMSSLRVGKAYFRELVIFDDFGKNEHKRDRFKAAIARITPKSGVSPHEGVFVLRGKTGTRRILKNEREVAEHLAKHRGVRVIDPLICTVDQILRTCAGAKFIIGVEGSHLVHALMTMTRESSVLALQPPFRFATALKDVADSVGAKFGFVVGQQQGPDFAVSAEEIERTMDLMIAGSPSGL